MGLRTKNYGDSLKNLIFRGGSQKKQYRFKVWLDEKEGSGVY